MPPSLEGTHLFRHMPAADVEAIVSKGRLIAFKSGDVLTDCTEQTCRFLVMAKGHGRASRYTVSGEEATILWYQPGDFMGIECFAEVPKPYAATLVAMGSGEAYVWTRHSIREVARRYPQFMMNMVVGINVFFATVVGKYLALLEKSAGERLAAAVFHVLKVSGVGCDGGVEIVATNEHLAHLADVSVFTVSRLLKEWEREGCIAKKRNRLLVKKPECLEGVSRARR